MHVRIKLIITVWLIALYLGACGVAMVRPVTVNTHKRPSFNMTKVNRVAVLEATKVSNAAAAADIMSLRLLDHGFNVIERAKIKDVLNEYDIKLTHDEDVIGAKKLGEILDADSIIIVSISDFTSGQSMIPGGCTQKARIESVISMGVTARLVDIKTSEVIWVGAASTQDKSLQACLTRMSDELISSIIEN